MRAFEHFVRAGNYPVAMTLLGIGCFPANDPHNLGMMGMHGEAWVNNAIQEADLLIAIGMRFDDRVTGDLRTYAKSARKIHIEIDRAEINKNVPVDAALIGDAREVLEKLTPHIQTSDHSAWIRHIAELKGDSAVRDIQSLPDSGHLYAAHVINDLWKETRGEAVIVTDVGQHQMWESTSRSLSLITAISEWSASGRNSFTTSATLPRRSWPLILRLLPTPSGFAANASPSALRWFPRFVPPANQPKLC
jgi:acetolactate synthase-1/2/3 large subunit